MNSTWRMRLRIVPENAGAATERRDKPQQHRRKDTQSIGSATWGKSKWMNLPGLGSQGCFGVTIARSGLELSITHCSYSGLGRGTPMGGSNEVSHFTADLV